MKALEKPEGRTKGISYLTTRNVYDWRKKPYQLGDCISVKRWKRRSRLVAREFAFAEGHVVAAPKSAKPLAFEVGFNSLFKPNPLESPTAFITCSALPLVNEADSP